MKNSILLYVLLFAAMAGAQVINIPDAAFKSKLVTSATYNTVAADSSGDFIAVDANGDGQIQQDEADEVRELYLQNSSIASLEGIQFFSNLRVLYVQYNNLTAFNASAVTDLRELYCAHNQLTSLTVAGLDHLEILTCNYNQLSALSFTGGMEYFQSLDCSFNNITQLDFSACPQFKALSCASNNINYINLKNGQAQDAGATNNWTANGNLAYVCIDEDEQATVNNILATYGYTNATANPFCSFTPGGDYNTIEGTLTFDDEGNGCDSGDVSQKFVKVGTTMGTESCSAFTDASGHYEFYTLVGDFTVTPQFENAYYTATPSTETISFLDVNNYVEQANFCIAPNGASPDIEIVMEPIVPAVPGQDAIYKMVYKNKGNQVLTGTVNCTWEYSRFNFYPFSFVPYANNTVTNGNMATYTWNYSNLQPFESREIVITLGVHTPTDAYPVSVGDDLTFVAGAAATGDVLPADNNHELNQAVVASYSGNAITCIEGSTAPVTAIGEYLHYVVHFTNEGSETVANVIVENDLDPTQFDVNSIQILNSSLPVTASVSGNTLRLSMQNANLSATGGGNILFKAKTKNNLQMGSMVNNTARIFYDYSAPVNTNIATTTFSIMGTETPVLDNSVKIYPNPAKNTISVKADGQLQSVQLYDIQGRLLQTLLVSDTAATLDVSGRAAGVYFVKVITGNGLKVEKIVKE